MRLGGFISLAICVLTSAAGADPAQKAYDAGEPAEAATLWRDAAEAGDAHAALLLAQMLDTGDGVPRDVQEALRWYEIAAAAGLADAAFNAAAILDQRGRPSDAALHYARAAAAGHPRAQFVLGTLYEFGEGVTRNPQAARHWYEAASGSIPRAADRAGSLQDIDASEDTPPIAFPPSRNSESITLAWDAGADGAGRPFRVSLFSEGGDITTVETQATAVKLQLAEDAAPLRWRVTRAGNTTGWQPVEAVPGLPTIRILHPAGDVPARTLATELAEALEGFGQVEIRVARDPVVETVVMTRTSEQGDLAANIAVFLPALRGNDVEVVETLRADIVVAIAGIPGAAPASDDFQPMVKR